MEEIERLERRALEEIADGAGVGKIAELYGTYLRCMVIVEDDAGVMRAVYVPKEKFGDYDSLGWKHIVRSGAPSIARLKWMSKLNEEKEGKKREKDTLLRLRLNGEAAGRAFFKNPRGPFSPDEMRVIERARPLFEVGFRLQLVNERAREPDVAYRQLLESGVSEGLSSHPVLSAWKPEDAKVLILLPIPKSLDSRAEMFTHRLRLIFSVGFVARDGDEIAMIINASQTPMDEVRETMENVLRLCEGCACASGEFKDWSQLAMHVQRCRRMIELMHPKPGRLLSSAETGTEALLEAMLPVDESFLHPAVSRLLAYDRENGSALLETLRCYMRCGRRAGLAAERLFIHRNTLKYRLERIAELTHIDFEDEQEMFFLRISIEIQDRRHTIVHDRQ